MKPQGPHGMLAQPSHDEAARESTVASMRRYFTSELMPGNRELYETRLSPQFHARTGRAPATTAEVKELLEATFHYRAASLFGRATQELLWDTVGEGIERQIDGLNEKAAEARRGGNAKGSLTFDPRLVMPAYVESVDIHVMPGNFHTELGADDVLAGALYDRGAYVFSYGGRGEYMERLGVLAVGLIAERFPGFKPRRILDMGCGVGSSTLPLKAAWPEAEVFAIDVAAPMLRYAHARAESLGAPIHFSQQDAAHTDFPDGSFDLVISVLVHHEMPLEVIRANLAECHRLLAPGGITLHDGKLARDAPAPDAYSAFISEWFQRHNNEPYGRGYDADRDLQAAGFAAEDIFSGKPAGDDYLKGQIDGHSYVGAVKR